MFRTPPKGNPKKEKEGEKKNRKHSCSHHCEAEEKVWFHREVAFQTHSFREAEAQPLIKKIAKANNYQWLTKTIYYL